MPPENVVLQCFERMDRQLLDATMLAGHLVPAGSMFAFLVAHRAEVFPDADYADLFAPPGSGRAVPDGHANGGDRGRWMIRGSTRPRWCTSASGWRSRRARTGSMTR